MHLLFLISAASVVLTAYLASEEFLPAVTAYSPLLVAISATIAVIVSVSRNGLPMGRLLFVDKEDR